MQVFTQNTVTISYQFDTTMSATNPASEAITCTDAVIGGTKLKSNGLVSDLNLNSLSSRITNNNSTNFLYSYVRCDIHPKDGYKVLIKEIIVTQRSSKTGVSGQSQNYLFRIGCSLNGIVPNTTDLLQTTENRLFSVSYEANSFLPGEEYSTASGQNFVSLFLTARGLNTTNDFFDWYIDKIEVKVSYYKILELPVFTLNYNFNNKSKYPSIEGINKITASNISTLSAFEGITDFGKLWIKTAVNTNTVGFKNMGLLFDITPETGYEVVLKNYEIIHGGSGVATESRMNQLAVYRDFSRSNAGFEAGREDFTSYTGRSVFGDNIPATGFKTTKINDDFTFNSQLFFNLSINRTGTPADAEYWTVEDVKVNGWIIPIGRGSLVKSISQGEQLLLAASVGNKTGQYTDAVYTEFLQLLLGATETMNNLQTSETDIENLKQTIQQAVDGFPDKANSGKLVVKIDKQSGVPLNEGFAGFNMRIADGPWTYTHPEFIDATRKMNPGFLRYFSGTSGDYFDVNTGQYELQWFEAVTSNPGTGGDDGSLDEFSTIPDLYKWMEGKGAHRFSDFNEMCGDMGTKLVVTWSGFFDTPAHAATFARFCKNNNITVDCWQFCNEPNFFAAPRRYFWNDGEDYAYKMKEIADSIKFVFPDANLALSYGWGFGTDNFASQIKQYQSKNNRYWNTVSVHAYPTHRSDVIINDGLLTANNALDVNTNNSYFSTMVNNSWANSKLLITEFGVWNDALNNTNYSAIYVAEYFMRLSQQPQAWMIAKHHIASAFNPLNKYKTEIATAYENQTPLNTDLLSTGYKITTEGFGHLLINKAFKNSGFTWKTTTDNTETVDKRGGSIPAIYASAYKGINDRDYLLISNKTKFRYNLRLVLGTDTLRKTAYVEYFSDVNPQNAVNAVTSDTLLADAIIIKPFSIMRIEWMKDDAEIPAPLATRIYKVEHNQNSVKLKWWKREISTKYIVKYGISSGDYTKTLEVNDNSAVITGLLPNQIYYFAVQAINNKGAGLISNEVCTKNAKPLSPEIDYVHEDNERITLHWESVAFANGYIVKYGTSSGTYTQTVDAKNVSGYVIRRLKNSTKYFITVSAYNGNGESQDAVEINARPVANRPWAPYLVNANENTNGSVTVSWTPSDSTYGANFNVYYCPTPWNDSKYELAGGNISGTSFTDNHPRSSGYNYYRVKAINQIGISQFYSAIATVDKVKDGITAVYDLKDINLNIFPNPANNIINFQSLKYGVVVDYKIFDCTGRMLKQGCSDKIDIADCASGLLLLEIKTNDKTLYGKVIKR